MGVFCKINVIYYIYIPNVTYDQSVLFIFQLFLQKLHFGKINYILKQASHFPYITFFSSEIAKIN